MSVVLPDLETTAQGVILPVKAQPKSRRDSIVGIYDGRLKVTVTQAPEKGKANAAIAKLLAKKLGIKHSQLSLISGETSTQKKFLITDVSIDVVRRRIAASLPDADSD